MPQGRQAKILSPAELTLLLSDANHSRNPHPRPAHDPALIQGRSAGLLNGGVF
jgi:hypothetical protein